MPRAPCSRNTTRTPHACTCTLLLICTLIGTYLVYCFVGVIALCCAVLCSRYCCGYSTTTYSYIYTTKKRKKQGEKAKKRTPREQRKQELQEGSPPNNFVVGKHGLRRAEVGGACLPKRARSKGRSRRQLFFQIFFFFFPKKNRKHFQSLEISQRAKYLERFAFQYLGKKRRQIWKSKKLREIKKTGNLDKSHSVRTARSMFMYIF